MIDSTNEYVFIFTFDDQNKIVDVKEFADSAFVTEFRRKQGTPAAH